MKPRILFVDDEENVLQGLRRMLRHMRREWEMEFVTSGTDALQLLEHWPADAVVSDMKMPVMDGHTLLNELRERHPRMIRIVLSGHVDPGQMLVSLGPAQQCLIKPCEPEKLIATVCQSIEISAFLQNRDLRSLVSSLQTLPTPRAVISELVDALQKGRSSAESVGTILCNDVALTAMTLKLVNSGFFSLRSTAVSPVQAIDMLGLEIIRSLVLTSGFFAEFEGAAEHEARIARLSRRSMRLGATAKLTAKAVHGEGMEADLAMCAGMLCHVGHLVLFANRPDEYAEAERLIDEDGLSIVEAERQVFDASHAEIGGYLLGLWGFSYPIVRAVTCHHEPSQSSGHAFDTLAAVHTADGLIKYQAEGNDDPAVFKRCFDQVYLKQIGMADQVRAWCRDTGMVAARED